MNLRMLSDTNTALTERKRQLSVGYGAVCYVRTCGQMEPWDLREGRLVGQNFKPLAWTMGRFVPMRLGPIAHNEVEKKCEGCPSVDMHRATSRPISWPMVDSLEKLPLWKAALQLM